MDKLMAEIRVDVIVDCPRCEWPNNLMSSPHDDEGEISKPLFNNKWDELQGAKFMCISCNHEFKIDGVEY